MQLLIDGEKKEIKEHGSYEFPLRISHERLSWFDTKSFPWHWHPEIELTLILEGNMIYQINETRYQMEAGQGLFCNSNMLHAGGTWTASDCHYLSVTFHPRLLYGFPDSLMDSKFVEPIIAQGDLSSIYLKPEIPWTGEILREIKKITDLEDAVRSRFAELTQLISLLTIWQAIYEHATEEEASATNSRDTERIRTIMDYIGSHFQEPLTLECLADQVHLCKSETCRMFRRYMKETIFDYLMKFRIERSLELLKNESLNISQIAEAVGFSTPAYFTKNFREQVGITPMAYRKKLLYDESSSQD